MFALVLPDAGDAAVTGLYTYFLPPALQQAVQVGGRVTVPLGSRSVAGYVLEITEQTDVPLERIRPVLAVKSAPPAFTPEQAALARWLAERYLCPLSEALRPCLADTGGANTKRRWQVTDNIAVTTLLPDPTHGAVLDYLRRHPGASGQQITEQFGEAGAAALDGLAHDGLIRPAGGKARAKERLAQAVSPAWPAKRLREAALALPARSVRQAECLHWLADHYQAFATPLPIPDLARRAGVSDAVIRTCVEKGWLRQQTVSIRRNPWENVHGRQATPPTLNPAQQYALDAISVAIHAGHETGVTTALFNPEGVAVNSQGCSAQRQPLDTGVHPDVSDQPLGTGVHPDVSGQPLDAGCHDKRPASFLLYGVTGSGKTEVFLHAIAEALAQGTQTIVLVPEISLTSQAMALYHGRFPGQVAVLHSHLSPGERFDEWQRIAGGEARVVLGARSAIFAPCRELGLLIIDEEHESSYKQESSPRYHAKAVALERARLCGAPVVLASATPSLDTMREAELGRHTLLRLPERIEDRPMPPVKLVDLRRMTAGAKILSAPLREAIGIRLAAGEQTILFLNRRGFAHTLLCRDCGRQEMCPHCAVPLTYHQYDRSMRCHHCDHTMPAVAVCPDCKGLRIAFRGIGTERLEQEVQGLWPEARLGRLDRDTTGQKGAHHAIIERFRKEETDILIGTQMVAKGFDFPKVTLVGVIAADTSLGVPDFRAPERTFQLLTQVAGRAGRGAWAGEVLVQTYQPEHYAIQMAMRHDYDTFYQHEIIKRGDPDACWPPLTALINIVVSGEAESEVKATAAALARRAREEGVARLKLPDLPASPMLPGLFELLVNKEELEEEEEEDLFGAEELLQRELPAGITVNTPAPCPLARLRGRYRYHLVLRAQEHAALLVVARALQELTPPRGVSVTFDIDPLSLA